MKYLFIFLISFYFLSGCKTIALTAAGIKTPQVEDAQSQQTFLLRQNLEMGIINTIPSFDNLMPLLTNGIGPSSVYVFDRSGNNLKLPGAEKNKCGPEPTFFLQKLDLNTRYERVDDLTLDTLANWLQKMDGSKLKVQQGGADFYVFLTWAMWQGDKIFEKDIKSSIEAAQKNNNAKLQLYLVNLDKQRSWGEANLKKVHFTKTSMNVMYK